MPKRVLKNVDQLISYIMIAEETRLELNFARSLSQNQAYEWGKNPLSFFIKVEMGLV